jgi:hypothetical protein
LVGWLAYWFYWLSKLAEASDSPEERQHLFTLKRNGLILLAKSGYVQIRKLVPRFHKKMCYQHHSLYIKKHMNPHVFIFRNWEMLESCPKCEKGIEHYFSLYSVAVLNEKEDIKGRKPLFVMYGPYGMLKDEFPDLDSLKSLKKYYGNELCYIDVDKKVYELDTKAFSIETIFKYLTKNCNDLAEYLK